MLQYIIPAAVALFFLGSKAKAVASSYSLNTTMLKEPNWSKWDSLLKKYGSQFGIDWKLLKAIAMNESSLGTHPAVVLGLREPSNLKSVSDDKKSWGLMQIVVATANDVEKGTTYVDLNDPEKSIRIAAKYFAFVKRQFPKLEGKDLERAMVTSYNQGYGNTLKGKTYANEYYARFLRNLALVNSKT